MADRNPFRYGDLALDESFTDRELELAELRADALNGQNVVVFAPRRYGKSSLVWRLSQQLVRKRVLVAQVDLMRAPTRERLAEKLAQAIHEQIASPLFRARERLRVFQGLRISPTITVDPADGSVGFAFRAGHAPEDLDATLERLLELPAQLAAERGRRVVMVFDEFQEVVEIDPGLPALMRAIFQAQPEVAHIYLGSKRHMIERLFNDRNEPFWRSAKQLELGVIEPAAFRPWIDDRLRLTDRSITEGAMDDLLALTGGHPYATQELCYFLWEELAGGAVAGPADVDAALARVLQSENAHFSRVWEKASRVQRVSLQALAREPGRPLAAAYRGRHGLPAASSVQRAVEALETDELIGRGADGLYRITEPFLAAWVRRFGS